MNAALGTKYAFVIHKDRLAPAMSAAIARWAALVALAGLLRTKHTAT